MAGQKVMDFGNMRKIELEKKLSLGSCPAKHYFPSVGFPVNCLNYDLYPFNFAGRFLTYIYYD